MRPWVVPGGSAGLKQDQLGALFPQQLPVGRREVGARSCGPEEQVPQAIADEIVKKNG